MLMPRKNDEKNGFGILMGGPKYRVKTFNRSSGVRRQPEARAGAACPHAAETGRALPLWLPPSAKEKAGLSLKMRNI
jgi:hypothetical protein